jgi:GDP-L-fucose synthase
VRILVTGGGGFIGKNLARALSKYHDVHAPSRAELDVCDKTSVERFLSGSRCDILLHCALARRGADEAERAAGLEKSFALLAGYCSRFEKIIYPGSGAEYCQSRSIRMASEDEIGRVVPESEYGLAKYRVNEIARRSVNIYNLRIFGCYGPGEDDRRFISHAIRCCLDGKPVTITQDRLFDFVYVDDLCAVVNSLICGAPKYHDYNVVTGSPVKLSDVAWAAARILQNKKGVVILKEGMNYDYTGSNARLLNEFPDIRFTALERGIEKQAAAMLGGS